MMNFDYWDGELTVYEGVSPEDNDSAVFMFIKNKDGGYSFSVDSDYEVVVDKEVKDGLAELDTNTYFTIRKKKNK